MSFDIVKTTNFSQLPFQYVPQEILGEHVFEEFITLGGIISDLKHTWHAKGPCLEVRNILSGRKVGSWTFGGILKDSNTKIIAVDELKRPNGRLPLLVIALECTISGGLICVFDIFGSKVLRVIQVIEQITKLHVVDSGCENSVLPDPSPLRYFDGVVAVGTLGGNVYLLDICRQTCENAILDVDSSIRDELNPCPMVVLKKEKICNIKKSVEKSVEREEHLAIHINVVVNPSTEHFTLKGENGEDRVHVNRTEVEVSSLFYSPQIASLLVGYNFGAFQLWDLRALNLVYTSPVCDEHIPVMHFTVQEPADDPKAYCYIWVSYSHNLLFHSGLPFTVMYSFYYDNKTFINGYGILYEDFQHCSIRFQIELGDTNGSNYKSRVKGGSCLGFQSVNKYLINKDLNSLSLCLISWLVWNSQKEVNACIIVFDLNQWYKEQMPRAPNWQHCSNYIIRNSLSNHLLDIKLDQKTLSQFIGIQRLEEHFCPTSLSFDLLCITDNSVLKVHNKGQQQAFIDRIVEDQHLSLVRPEDYFEQIGTLGLVPLFCEIQASNSMDIDYQREILLNVALEQKLIGWLCKCTTKLANNAFNASGLSIYNILNWAFERAITLKSSCDSYCSPLFDYSGTRLDNNIISLINGSLTQIRNICSLYRYVSSKLMSFISDKEAILEEQRSLENVVVYFEVLLWMVNIGLLPECPKNGCRSYDDGFVNAPYMVQDLTRYYDRKRAQLQMASTDTFVEKDCLLFIDNLINNKGGAEQLSQQWQEDGGSGLYPPPSLQSVLRIYFLNVSDVTFKHSLVTYTLLDIAMTVDEDNKVIKLLLKFPQIFDLSQSNIKIVQAFWHLDHDDYEKALEYVLDPCVLTEDLQHWHHSVMMRSLLLQEQPSLALLYLQIRKPSIQNEKDLLTVISLLISKNMLDEAFKFRQQHQVPNEQALLLHIFNECNKNELLHSLLYRRLDNNEEKAFFKYLQNTRNPRCEDLKVFYYLLRSRFLEAFDTYSAMRRRKPESQGLIGQRDATTADNIVKMFKTLLPDVNRNLVELVGKERNNLWKEVEKPTPLSVFVHNARDQVQYKSSVIFAALAKAKQTFNDTLNDTKMINDVATEDTPFLRTPTCFRQVSNVGTPLLKSKVIEQNEKGEEYGPSPCKRLKLSPRASKTSPMKPKNLSLSTIQSKLSTPIIKRKRLSLEQRNTTSVLPQSILKGSSVSRTILDDSIFDENTSVNTSLQLECENSVRRSRLALTPRKPMSRTPTKSHVKFDDLRYSGSPVEQSSKNESPLQNLIPERSRSMSGNSTASTVDELFYSPDNSLEESAKSAKKLSPEIKKSLSPVRGKLEFDDTLTEEDVKEEPPKKTYSTNIPLEESDLSTNRLTFQSPKSRRSYKKSFGDSPVPVRSSPRLAQKVLEESKETSTSSESSVNKTDSLEKPSPSVAVQKLRGRKSLSRAVLEHNAYSHLRSSNVFEETRKKSNVSSAQSDSESDEDMEQSHDDSLGSLDAIINKYKTAASSGDSPFDINDSPLSNARKSLLQEGEVISKITEVQHVETRRENIRKSTTHELVSSRETREEHHSKTVELIEQNDTEDAQNEEPVDPSVYDEVTQDCNTNKFKKSEDVGEEDKNSEATEKRQSLSEDGSDELLGQDEDINIYEDLSSGSDDVKEVLKRFEKKEEMVYEDISFSTSRSYYGREKDMPEKFMEGGDSNSNDDVSKSPPHHSYVYDNDVDMTEIYDDIPETEKAFVNTSVVIEIVSSSDEEPKRKSDADESSQSSSSSSEESHSSTDESSLELNAKFEKNLNESSDEKSSNDDDLFMENCKKIIQSEEELKEKQMQQEDTHEDGNEELDNPEDNQINTNAVIDENSSSVVIVSSDTERQYEMGQKETVEAVKMLQSRVVAEGIDIEQDDEHMDSLILEEASPEKEERDRLEPKIVPISDEKDSEDVRKQEIPGRFDTNEEIIEDKQDKTKENELLSSKEQDSSKKTEDELNAEDVEQKETSTSPVKQSKSLQCTLGADDTVTSSTNQEESILSIEEQVTSNKNTIPSETKQSKSLQCTLGDHSMILDSSEEVEVPVTLIDEDQSQSKSEIPLVLGSVEKARQATFESENKNITEAKHSMGLQCTLGDHSTVLDSSGEVEIPATLIDEDQSQSKADTPLVLRSVKKTYKGRKGSESADLDATPKLAVSLIKRTYSRKESGLGSKTSDNTETGDSDVAAPDEPSEEETEPTEKNVENTQEEIISKDETREGDKNVQNTQEEDVASKEVGESDKALEDVSTNVKNTQEEVVGSMEVDENTQDEVVGSMEVDESNVRSVEDGDKKDEAASIEKSENVQKSPPEDQDMKKASKTISNEEISETSEIKDTSKSKRQTKSKKDVTSSEDKEKSKSKGEEIIEATKTVTDKNAGASETKDESESKIQPVMESSQIEPKENSETSVDKDKLKSKSKEILKSARTATKEEAETSQAKDESRSKSEENTKPQTVRVTRRRSMLLSQQEGSSTSVSEESVSSSSSDVKRSKSIKEGSNGVTEPSQSSENLSGTSKSQSTLSHTSSSRRTRKSSQFDESFLDSTFGTEPSVLNTEVDIMESSVFEHSPLTKPGPSKTLSRRSSKHDEPVASEKQASQTLPKKRTRSASVDHLPASSVSRKKSMRSKSIDLDVVKVPEIDSRTSLRVILTPIQEQAGPSVEKDTPEDEVVKPNTKAYSDVGAYTTSRRLTRRQASMLKTIGSVEKEMKRFPSVDEMDPLQLLDKSEFDGQPDPDEAKVYEENSPTSSSGTLLRHVRSASVASDASTPSTRMTRARSEQLDTPASGIKSRLRRQSLDAQSVASEQSDSPSPSKKSKKKESEGDADLETPTARSNKRGRSRTNSMSSTKSAGSDKSESSVRTTRSRRIHSVKSELPEIKEEKGSDEGDSADTSVIKKRGRKRKE